MKDFDFDELDQAVNSLMSDVPENQPASSTDNEKTLNIPPTLKEGEKPPLDKLASSVPSTAPVMPNTQPAAPPREEPKEEMPTPTPAEERRDSGTAEPQRSSSLPARRAGRFMDVVHPSADMKKPTPDQKISRQGVTLEPTGEVAPEAPSLTSADKDTATSATSPGPITPPNREENREPEKVAPANEWPDPLEMVGFKDEATAEKAPDGSTDMQTPEEVRVPTDTKPEMTDKNEEAETPLTSPFLPGAKVEKRPLGVGATTAPEPMTPKADTDNTLRASAESEAEAQLPPKIPGAPEPKLPEELRDDVMAIEADTHEGMPKTEDTAVSAPVPVAHTPKPAPKQPEANREPASVPQGPTSIPQQYKEEPTTGDKEHSAIYDTDTYHQPLAHPAKKKSGWLWVLWIVIILILGAGGGAALYYLGLV